MCLQTSQGKLTYVPPVAGEDDEEEKQPDTYEGEMEHGTRQGKGTYKWSNGTVYEGTYVNGKKHGKGKLTFPDKSVYQGRLTHMTHHRACINVGAPSCCSCNSWYLVALYSDRDVRDSDGNACRQGPACMLLLHAGEFVEDVMEGQAMHTYANGDIYQGAYKANKKSGKGMYHYKVRQLAASSV